MPTLIHTSETELRERRSPIDAYSWFTTPRLGNKLRSKHLEFDIRSLSPGKYSFPYHFHRYAEEIFLILSGEATLRTPEGFQKVKQGDLIFFEMGESSAHQMYNHSDKPCTYFDLRTTVGMDVSEYPDTGKLAILPDLELFNKADQVNYFEGEENIEDRWPREITRSKDKSE